MFKTFLSEQDEDKIIKSIKRVFKIDDHGELEDGVISVQLSKGVIVTDDNIKSLAKSGIIFKKLYINNNLAGIDLDSK